MHKPKKRYNFCYKKNHLSYRRDGSKTFTKKIDNLDELISKSQKQLAKVISKRQKQLAKEEPKKKLKESITKIESSKKKAYESFNVDIINNKDTQVQLHKSKELTKDFLIGELNKSME